MTSRAATVSSGALTKTSTNVMAGGLGGAADLGARGGVGRDRGDEDEHAVLGEQARDVADAADVGVAVGAREREAGGEERADLVAVEQLDRALGRRGACASAVASVDLPAPERPVSQTMPPLSRSRAAISPERAGA